MFSFLPSFLPQFLNSPSFPRRPSSPRPLSTYIVTAGACHQSLPTQLLGRPSFAGGKRGKRGEGGGLGIGGLDNIMKIKMERVIECKHLFFPFSVFICLNDLQILPTTFHPLTYQRGHFVGTRARRGVRLVQDKCGSG